MLAPVNDDWTRRRFGEPHLWLQNRDDELERALDRSCRRRSPFRQADLTKALKATTAAGIDVGRIEIDSNGKIVIVTSKSGDSAEPNALDAWIKRHADTP